MRLCLIIIALAITLPTQDKFTPNGDPFKNFEKETPFDSSCPKVSGNAQQGTGSFAQNLVKNNLSAKAPAKDITIQDLASLQQEIKGNPGFKSWGPGKEPKNRAPFHNMSGGFQEGQLVRLTAYIFEAHTADTDAGESVNCGFGTNAQKAAHPVPDKTAQTSNDIHIALVGGPNETDECKSVTAEVIPHFRPPKWDESLFKSNLSGKLVRLTGQLMFDASHKPCTASKKESPARQSLWEVHPVYQVEVCDKDDGHGKCTGQWKTVS